MKTKKYVMHKFGRDCYYIGQDVYGINYFLQEAKFDCGWYWGGGYVETYTNNRSPKNAKDICTHQHFDDLFLNGKGCPPDLFKAKFPVNPFTNDEIWKICELMKAFYTARHYSDMLHIGGAHYTTNPAKELIMGDGLEYRRINSVVIPAINEALYEILGKEGDE